MTDDFSIADEDTMAFLTECRELIEEVEPYMVELSQQTGSNGQINIETINFIFRVFHTIKGSASFFQFDNIVNVTHEAETILELLKQKQNVLTENLIDALFQTCDFINEMLNQCRDVRIPLPEWRYPDRKHIEAEPQILAEQVSLHHGFQVAVCGSDDPYIQRNGFCATDSFDLFALQHLQQSHLRRRWQLTNLIEEDSTFIRTLKTTTFLGQRAGESASLMPKEFTVYQCFRDSTTIHTNERCIPAFG